MKQNDERAKQVVKAWLEDGTISKRFLSELVHEEPSKAETITLLPSKKFVTPKKIYPGMFCYSTEDNLIFAERIPELEKQITSVVSHVTKNEVFSLCRKQKELPWSSDYLRVKMSEGLSGVENTRLILAAAKAQGKKAEAAQYCHDYCLNGVEQGSAFLFSKEELQAAFPNYEVVNQSLCQLGVELPQHWFWSSSEYNAYYTWSKRFGDGVWGSNSKIDSYYVRPGLVLKFDNLS